MQISTKTLSVVALDDWQAGHLTVEDRPRSGLFEYRRHKLRSSAGKLMSCFNDFGLWFSLPLSIWLTTGWIGLIAQWEVIAEMASPTDKLPLKETSGLPQWSATE